MKVPRLEAGGANWVVYKDRFLWAVDARGLLEHVDGSEREPVCSVNPGWFQEGILRERTPKTLSRMPIQRRKKGVSRSGRLS